MRLTWSWKRALRRAVWLGPLLVLAFCATHWLYADDKAPAATPAPTPPPAAAVAAPAAPTSPIDPTGATSGKDFAVDGGGTAFTVADPGPAPTDPAAKKTWDESKKSFDEFTAQSAKEPLAVKLAETAGHNRIAINIVWTLITGFLVMFMQAGFALVETGLCRAKNASHTMAMNFMIYPLGMLGFYVCGFAFMFGGANQLVNGASLGVGSTLGPGVSALDTMIHFTIAGKQIDILGWKGFFLGPSVYDVSIFTLFLFQMVFMDTTATIPTGSMAERWKFSAFVLYGCAIGTILYPVYGGWVWGGGWLARAGTLFGLGPTTSWTSPAHPWCIYRAA